MTSPATFGESAKADVAAAKPSAIMRNTDQAPAHAPRSNAPRTPITCIKILPTSICALSPARTRLGGIASPIRLYRDRYRESLSYRDQGRDGRSTCRRSQKKTPPEGGVESLRVGGKVLIASAMQAPHRLRGQTGQQPSVRRRTSTVSPATMLDSAWLGLWFFC